MKYIALEELQKHIIHDGCDEGCGYIDERDLAAIPTLDLDGIRTEIEQITDTMGVSYNQYVSKIDVLQIIDKYKGSEDKE